MVLTSELLFLPDAATMLAYTVACVVLFITPGPDMSLFLARTIAGGRAAGIAAMLGTNVGCLVHTILAAAGVSAILAASEAAFTVLKIVGAGYLLWLAYDAIRSGSALNVSAPSAGSPETSDAPEPSLSALRRTFLMGLAVNLTNPKVVLFFVTFLPQFVAASDPAGPQKMLFLGIYFVLFNIPLAVIMILGAARLIGFLKARPLILRAIDYVFAGVFGIFAAKILATQGR